jgi:hypothetical protein
MLFYFPGFVPLHIRGSFSVFLDCDLMNQVHVMPRRKKGPEASEKETRRVGSVCRGRGKKLIQSQLDLFFHL